MLATSAAVTAGGLFSISAEEYFEIGNMYYIVFLGFGMTLLCAVLYTLWDGEDVKKLQYEFIRAVCDAGIYNDTLAFRDTCGQSFSQCGGLLLSSIYAVCLFLLKKKAGIYLRRYSYICCMPYFRLPHGTVVRNSRVSYLHGISHCDK